MSAEAVADLAVRTSQLVSIHDVRLRELSVLIPQVRVPLKSSYGAALQKVDADWKKAMATAREQKSKGETTERLGSKHVRLAMGLIDTLFDDVGVKKEVRDFLVTRYQDKDKTNPETLAVDVRLVKWRTSMDGKNGILEIRFGDEMKTVEQEVIRRIVENGGVELTGVPPKAARVRELDDMLKDTWAHTRKRG